jgi:hypothetical protein
LEINTSQNKKPKEKLGPRLENSIVINQPTVRDYSTGGGHLPGDTIIEGGSIRLAFTSPICFMQSFSEAPILA